VGDDAALISMSEGLMAVTTDLLLEGIHFNLVYTPLKHLGYKAVVVNLSDLYAMNAVPKQITFSLGVSSKFHLEDIEELYSGIKLACEQYRIDLVGGDTTSSYTGMTISVTALGSVDQQRVVKRSGAKPGDVICVTGDLGAAYLGLQLLERENKIFQEDQAIEPRLDGYEYVLERQLKPEIRLEVAERMQTGKIIPSAMIDVSDGLSSDVMHICKQSGTGCKIYVEEIPIHPATQQAADEFNMAAETAALNGGEDYELLFTVPPAHYEELAGFAGITRIGHITSRDEGIQLVTSSGSMVPLKAQGWDPVGK
jgi:thiamine-monophosphate kinase